MKDLNSEINATAQRTQFNGIKLLTSGSSIDLVNSDLKSGVNLTNTQVKVKVDSNTSLGYYSQDGAGANLGDSANTRTGGGGVASTFTIALDSELQKKTPGTYTLSANGANLTLTGTFNGLTQSQTVTIADAVGNTLNGPDKVVNQSLDFNNFGIKLNLKSTIGSGATETGAQLASAFVARSTSLVVDGKGGEITDVRLSGVAPGTYNMSFLDTGTLSSLALGTPSTGVISGVTTAGTITGVSLANTSSSGTSGTADLSYDASGNITGISVNAAGSGYKAGDVLNIAAANDRETGTVTIGSGLTSGQTLTLNGLTFTANTAADTVQTLTIGSAFAADEELSFGTKTYTSAGSLSASAEATAIATAFNAAGGHGTGWTVAASGSTVTFTKSGYTGNQTGVAVTGTALPHASIAVTTVGRDAGATAAQVAAAFNNIAAGATAATVNSANSLGATQAAGGSFTGTADSAWSSTSSGTAIVFTSATAGGVTDFTGNISGTGSAAATVTANHQGTRDRAAITGIVVSGLATATGDHKLQLSGTVNGVSTTQTVALQAGAANTKQSINFDSFGVQFDVTSYQDQTASEIGQSLAVLNHGSSTGYNGLTGQFVPGQIVVAQGNNSNLKFQSGADTDAYIEINTVNVQTGTNGTNAGSSAQMMNLGTRVTGSGAGNLGTLSTNNTIDEWQTAFKNAADAVDQAVEYVSTTRATYGSQMNRLSYISTNLQAQSTNLQNSRSAIIDTDFASETAKLTKGQIMQQAATAMLAQANQMPNVILSLLK